MTTDQLPNQPGQPVQPGRSSGNQYAHPSGSHGGHGWMMIACCVPMLLVAVVLVATGTAGAGFLVSAVVCTLMMATMMGGTGHGSGRGH